MVKIYCARKMTGLSAKDVVEDAKKVREQIKFWFGKRVKILDPVEEEGVKSSSKPISSTPDLLQRYWQRDKEMIREAHVLLDLAGPAKSEGVLMEIGYARFFLFKPVVRIWPNLGSSVGRLEADAVVDNLNQAIFLIDRKWGTPYKRFKWRFALIKRCLINYLRIRFLVLIDWR